MHTPTRRARWRHARRTQVFGAVAACLMQYFSLTAGTPVARADGNALNGTFVAASDGGWAKVRDRFEDVPSVRSTWTITSTCNTSVDCHGAVVSDQGWSAELTKTSQVWRAARLIPDWQQCPDGTSSPGRQIIRFWPIDEQGVVDLSGMSTIFAGEDRTLGESGACGVSKWLIVKMPFIMRQAG
jgi:hypothetical protein